MTALYSLQLVAVAVALSCAAFVSPRWLPLPGGARFAFGLCCTPLAVSATTLLVALAWPGAPATAFMLFPLVLALAVLGAARSAPVACSRRLRRWSRSALRGPLHAKIAWLGAAIGLVFVTDIALWNAAAPLIAHDALVYFNEAKAFAASRSLASIPGFFGHPDDLFAAHPHTFLFQAYLSQALLCGPGDALGYPNDQCARMAVQATVPLLMLAIAVLGARTRVPGGGACALLFALLVPQFDYLSSASSRDGFRLIPLVLALATLPVGYQRAARLPPLRSLAAPALMLGWGLAAHTLNAVAIFIMGLVVAVLVATGDLRMRHALAIGCSAAAGLALPLTHYAVNWIDTGHPLGFGLYYRLYPDTPLLEAFRQTAAWSGDASFLDSLGQFANRYGTLVTYFPIACALLALSLSARSPQRATIRFLCLAYLFLLCLPLLGAFEFGLETLRGALLSNLRYPLQTYAIAGTAVVLAFAELEARAGTLGSDWTNHAVRAAAIVLVALLAIVSTREVDLKWRRANANDARALDELYLSLRDRVASELRPGESWVTDLASTRYYVDRRPIHLYTTAGRALIAAKSEVEVWAILEQWNVRLVALYNKDPNWWPRTALHRALADPGRVTAQTGPNGTIYLIRYAPIR